MKTPHFKFVSAFTVVCMTVFTSVSATANDAADDAHESTHAPAAETPAKAPTKAAKKTAATTKPKAAKKSKESVKKIAVGPAPSPSPTPEIAPATTSSAAAVESDDADSVDQPIPRAKIESTDAPGVKLEASEVPLGAAIPATAEIEDNVVTPIASPSPKAKVTPQPKPSEGLVELHEGAEYGEPATSESLSALPPLGVGADGKPLPPSPTPAPAPEASAELGKNPTSADQSLKWLMNGNTRFVNKAFRADGRSGEDRLRSSTQQKPHAIILACSESVTPPELIFDQGIGEITTIRVAGPQIDASVISSLEQAVRNYDTHLILVLGHTQCSSLEGSPYIGTKKLDPDSKHEVEAALNADGIARDLTSKSAFLKSRVEAKQLTIKSALYWIDTGKVKLY